MLLWASLGIWCAAACSTTAGNGGGDAGVPADAGSNADATPPSDSAIAPTSCGPGTMEFPYGSGTCIDDPCIPDPCGGTASCSNSTGAAVCSACTFFVDSVAGLDGNAGTSSTAPWQTLTNLTTVTLSPGDNVCFKRGDSFVGPLTVNQSGASGTPIRFGSYGDGDKPIISGLATITGWTQVSDGIWKAPCTSCGDTVSVVTIDGVFHTMGRTPNTGYFTEDTVIGPPVPGNEGYYGSPFDGTLGFIDNELPSTPNWVGATVVIRKANYVFERELVTVHDGTTINYLNRNVSAGFAGQPGWGYFFQNSLQTLDQPGEWFFDPTDTDGKQLYVFFGAADPNVAVVKASAADSVVSIVGKHDIAIEGIALRGANSNAVVIDSSIALSGNDGVHTSLAQQLTIERSTIADSYNAAIELLQHAQDVMIANNTILRTGLLPGVSSADPTQINYTGILVATNDVVDHNILIEGNLIDGVGYNGIGFFASGVTIQHNVIENFTTIADDGGGVYTWRNGEPYVNRNIIGNIILDGHGALDGKPLINGRMGSGIYLDNATNNVKVQDNSIARCSLFGMLDNFIVDVAVTGNTFFDSTGQIGLWSRSDVALNADTFSDNIFFARTDAEDVVVSSAVDGQVQNFGTFDGDYYVRPTQDDVLFHIQQSAVDRFYSLAGWQDTFGFDLNGGISPVVLAPYSVTSMDSANLIAGGDFEADAPSIISWSQDNSQTAVRDTSGKVNGSGSLQLSFSAPSNNYALIYAIVPFGAVDSSKTYLLRVTTTGTSDEGLLGAALRMTEGPTYAHLTPEQKRSFGTEKTVHEFLFANPTSDPAGTFELSINEFSGTVYIDDIELYEVTATTADPSASIRFEYNPSTAAKTIALDRSYVDSRNTSYDGTITLAPFTSAVLIKPQH